jgi:hypothetical protein
MTLPLGWWWTAAAMFTLQATLQAICTPPMLADWTSGYRSMILQNLLGNHQHNRQNLLGNRQESHLQNRLENRQENVLESRQHNRLQNHQDIRQDSHLGSRQYSRQDILLDNRLENRQECRLESHLGSRLCSRQDSSHLEYGLENPPEHRAATHPCFRVRKVVTTLLLIYWRFQW